MVGHVGGGHCADALACASRLSSSSSPFVALRRRRVRWKEFVLLALSLPAFLFAAEVAVRLKFFGIAALMHPARYQPFGAMSNPDYLAAASDPRIVYTLRPGYEGWVKEVFVRANSIGLRDREFALEPPAGTCRIITLGSSVTMGEGVPADAGFPPSPSALFDRNSLALSAIHPPVSLRQRLDGWLSGGQAAASADDEFVARTLDHFGALARHAGFLGAIFVPRPVHSYGIADFQRAQRDHVRSLAVAAGLMYIDSYDRFGVADAAEDFVILLGELHPNAEGHGRHARALADGLAASLPTSARRISEAAGAERVLALKEPRPAEFGP